MSDKIKALADRYLKGRASKEEARKVLQWFQTEEGLKYVEECFDRDVDKFEDEMKESRLPAGSLHQAESIDSMVSSDSTMEARKKEQARKTLENIEAKIDRPARKKGLAQINRLHRHPAIRSVAACITFLVAVTVIMKLFSDTGDSEAVPPVEIIAHTTGADEKKRITLSDGTEIRLNQYSRLEMPETFRSGDRKVSLNGHAYFDVVSDPERPFIIQVNEAEIRVLGTAFDVKESPDQDEVYVAVSEGRVSFQSQKGEQQAAILEKDMIGLFNTRTFEIKSEQTDIHNYMSWIHGRLIFSMTPFTEVVRQLERIYGFQSELLDEGLQDLRLTADFSENTPAKVLEVIAQSLEIGVEKDGNLVKWTLDAEPGFL